MKSFLRNLTIATLTFLAFGISATTAGCDSGTPCDEDFHCGRDEACSGGECVIGQRCAETICGTGKMCWMDACEESPYGLDWELVLVSATASMPSHMDAHVTLGGVEVLAATSETVATRARWNVSQVVRVDSSQRMMVLFDDPDSYPLVDVQFDPVPMALLMDGELVVQSDRGAVVLRAFAPGAVAECLRDDECGGGNSCVSMACIAGERCDEILCDTDSICDEKACVASPFDETYTLSIVSAHMAAGSWDDNGGLAPDPVVRVYAGDTDTEILKAPVRSNTHDATWTDASVTRKFGAYESLRVELADVDVAFFNGGSELAFDLSFPRLPYAAITDGTWTVMSGENSVTLTVTAAE